MTDLSLAAEFPSTSFDEWRILAERTLKGASFDDRLVSRTYDGLAIDPLYTRANSQHQLPALHGPCSWAIMQPVENAEPAVANAVLHEELEGGATGVVLTVSEGDGHPGIAVQSLADLNVVLADVDVKKTPVRLAARSAGLSIAALAHAWHIQHGVSPGESAMKLAVDPYAAIVGGRPNQLSPRETIKLSAEIIGAGYREPPLLVNGHRIHAAGASEALELACAAAMGVEVLRELETTGASIETGVSAIRFLFASDADIFLTLAKLRAWPLVWSRITEACGVTTGNSRFSARTASRMLSVRDPSVNMLRATSAVFAAAVAGADEISVDPHTSALGVPDKAARRLARNTQTILREESNIGRIGDPAAGSWYADELTVSLAERAWSLFREIEAQDGMTDALANGVVQKMISKTDAARNVDIATRKLPVTGVSEYAALTKHETAVQTTKVPAAPSADVRRVSGWSEALAVAGDNAYPAFAGEGSIAAAPLPEVSLAAPYEALRDRSDAAAKTTGKTPAVFLATLGSPSGFAARVTWITNFFAAGGIDVQQPEGPGSIAAMLAAYKSSGTNVVCLCGSNDAYVEQAAEAATALKGAGATHIYVAGRPDDALSKAGIDSFIFAGCNVLESLDAAHALLSN